MVRSAEGSTQRMLIDGVEYALLKDYDRGRYTHLSFSGKVTYLEERVNLVLLAPCRWAMQSAAKTDLGLVLTTAICAGISAAGTFLKGRRAQKRGEDKTFFTDFVNRYMETILQSAVPGGTTWVEWLYGDVRCGLAHNFTIESGGVEYEVPSYVAVKPCGPEISPGCLLEDFANGWSKYLNDVRAAGPAKGLGALFEKRFDDVFHD